VSGDDSGNEAFTDSIVYTFADDKQVAYVNLGGREGAVAIRFEVESVYRGNRFDDVAVTWMEVLSWE